MPDIKANFSFFLLNGENLNYLDFIYRLQQLFGDFFVF